MQSMNEATPEINVPIVFKTERGSEIEGTFDGYFFISKIGIYFEPAQVVSWRKA